MANPKELQEAARFSIGDRVRVTGILADFYPEKTGVVVAVEPNANGIRELDRYVIEIQGMQMGDMKFADFQLAMQPLMQSAIPARIIEL